MSYFKVISPSCGLPLGRVVKVIPKFPLETGDFVVLAINGRITAGVWYADIARLSWVRQHMRLIPLIGQLVVTVFGVVDEDADHHTR